MNQPNFEQLKTAKEISDITFERDEIQRLLSCGCWEDLSKYLRKLEEKYMVETLDYNLTHPNPPATVEENARNCINFLNTLLVKKATDNLE